MIIKYFKDLPFLLVTSSIGSIILGVGRMSPRCGAGHDPRSKYYCG